MTTTYPLEAGERAFVPASLAHLKNPPTFILRDGTPREKAEHLSILRLDKKRHHSTEAMRDALFEGLAQLSTPEEFGEWEPRIREFFDAADQHDKELSEAIAALPEDATDEDRASLPTFEFEGKAEVLACIDGVQSEYQKCLILDNDNMRFRMAQPHAIAAVVIVDVHNLDVDLVRDRQGKYLTMDCAMEVAEALVLAAAKERVASPPLAVAELNEECQLSLFLGKRRAKNSASPVPSDPAPDHSKTGTGATDGKSKASGTSAKTPGRASPKKSGA